MRRYQLFGLFIFVLFFSCGKQSLLNSALEVAGDNRPELEKVLTYYSSNSSDSLKLRAARFLIENMPGHYSYKGDDILKYYEDIDSVLNCQSSFMEKYEHLRQISAQYPQMNRNLIEDIQIINSDYLIRNIDAAFELWAKPWASHLSFDEFCEALLPYKCAELQQLDYWRDSLTTKFTSIYDSGYDGPSLHYPFHHYKLILEDLNRKVKENQWVHYEDYYKPLSASNIDKLPCGSCADYETLLVSMMRSKGIPVVREYYPRWGKRNYVGHGWPTLINKSNTYLPAIWGYSSLPGDNFLPTDEIPKVFRRTYAHNQKVLEYIRKTKYVCKNIDVFSVDVTDKYTATSDLSIPINTKHIKDKFVYISMFSGRQWVVVDYGEIKRKSARFSKIGRNMIYMIYGYNGKDLSPVSEPFILGGDGSVKYLTPDTTNLRTVAVFRKYPVPDYDLSALEDRVIGGVISASDRADFKDFEVICTIGRPSSYVQTNTSKKYRFWRYYSKPGSYCNFAELQFFERDQSEPSKGKIIGNIDPHPDGDNLAEYLFDGNWLTTYHYRYSDGGWVGLDFGAPVNIERVMCVARSDDNNIHIGDQYELKYWGDGKWNSLGCQIAEDYPLYFKNVPDNTVLWLQNDTRGEQERIFMYEKGKQVWW